MAGAAHTAAADFLFPGFAAVAVAAAAVAMVVSEAAPTIPALAVVDPAATKGFAGFAAVSRPGGVFSVSARSSLSVPPATTTVWRDLPPPIAPLSPAVSSETPRETPGAPSCPAPPTWAGSSFATPWSRSASPLLVWCLPGGGGSMHTVAVTGPRENRSAIVRAAAAADSARASAGSRALRLRRKPFNFGRVAASLSWLYKYIGTAKRDGTGRGGGI